MNEQLKTIEEAMQNCRRCKLCQTRRHVVFGEGSHEAKLMFIGEGPGEQEDHTGRPFVGPAGQLLDKMIAAIGLKREEVYIANVVKCRPPGNADPAEVYAEACLPYLRAQVRLIHPKVIVCLGRIAMRYVLKEIAPMSRVHGKIYEKKDFSMIPTYHPSALLRNPELKKAA